MLVEGESDRRAVVVVAERTGCRLQESGVAVVAMGGATNAHAYATEVLRRWPGTGLSGLCDLAESSHFGRALLGTDSIAGVDTYLGRNGLFVCDPDLEAELIRAAGTDLVSRVIAEQGEEESFLRFANQQEWRGRDPGEQLKRFMGTRSGRKARYAGLLAAAIPVPSIPLPLTMLIEHLALGDTGPTTS